MVLCAFRVLLVWVKAHICTFSENLFLETKIIKSGPMYSLSSQTSLKQDMNCGFAFEYLY